jgi:hypothetical protein
MAITIFAPCSYQNLHSLYYSLVTLIAEMLAHVKVALILLCEAEATVKDIHRRSCLNKPAQLVVTLNKLSHLLWLCGGGGRWWHFFLVGALHKKKGEKKKRKICVARSA